MRTKTFITTIMLALVMGLAVNASAAILITNPNADAVFVAPGGSVIGETQSIQVTTVADHLAADSLLFIQLPTGVSFASAPVASSGNIAGGIFLRDPQGAPSAQLAGTVSDTNADGLMDRATWTVHATQTADDTVTMTNVHINVASTLTIPPAGFVNIVPTFLVGTPPLVTTNVIATAVPALATPAQNIASANLSADAAGQDASASAIVFTVPAGTAVGQAFTLTLPVTARFQADGTAVVLNDTETATVTAVATDAQTMTLTIATAALTAPSQILFSPGLMRTDLAPVGDLNVTIAGVITGTVKIATIALSGSTNAVVDATLKNLTRGAAQFAPISDITLTEIFDQDFLLGTFTLTLPTGVTFQDAGAAAGTDGLAAATALASNVITVTIGTQGTAGAPVSVLTLSSLAVTVANTYTATNIPLTITNVSAGVTTGTLVVANVIDPVITVTGPAPIPSVGTGAAVTTLGTASLKEGTVALGIYGSIRAGTIIITPPAGVTFAPATPPTLTGNVGTLALGAASVIAPDGTAFWTVTAESSFGGAETLTLTVPSVSIATTLAAGTALPFTLSGSSGVTGTVTLGTIAVGSTVAAAGVFPNPTAGNVNAQAIGNFAVTENFATGLTTIAGGQIRVVAPDGVTFSGATVSGIFTLAATGTTIRQNDTLFINATTTAGVDTGTVNMTGFVAAGVAGNLAFQIVDGNGVDATQNIGLPATTANLAFVGTVAALTATPATVNVGPAGTTLVAVTGGLGNISAVSSDVAVATVAVDQVARTVTVTGVAVGSATITITDSAATPVSITVPVAVVVATEVGVGAGILPAVSVAANVPVILNLSTDTAGGTAVNTWFVLTARIAGAQLPIFFVTTTGLVPLTAGMDLNAVTFAFTGPTLTLTPLTMADLTLGAGDQLIYGFAFMDAQGAISIPNIVTINVQ